MSKKVTKFKSDRAWVINGSEVKIRKVETSTHLGEPLPRFNLVHPMLAKYNIIRNVALLPNASFIEKDHDTVLACIKDVTGKTLIQTQWEIPVNEFNEIVTLLTTGKAVKLGYLSKVGDVIHASDIEQINESYFHVISKIS